jgi:HEAT repeat protein
MDGMERSRGRRVTLVAAACAAAVVVAAAIAGKDLILERWWIWRLGSKEPATWRAAAERLGEMRSVRAVPRLVEVYLREMAKDGVARDFPGQVLIRIGHPAVAALLKVVPDRTYLLLNRCDDVDPVLSCLEDPDRTVRLKALEALDWAISEGLVKIGRVEEVLERTKDIDLLIAAGGRLRIESRSIRGVLREGIGKFETPELRCSAILATSRISCRTGLGSRAIETALGDPSPDVRMMAAGNLDGERRALPALLRALGDPEPRVVRSAGWGIRVIIEGHRDRLDGGEVERIVEAIAHRLDFGDVDDREWVIGIVKALGPRADPAVPALIRLLDDLDWRIQALEALEAIGTAARSALPAIRPYLDGRFLCFREAARAICSIDDDPASILSLLADAVNPEGGLDFTCRRPAIEALGQMGKEAEAALPLLIAILVDAAKDDDERASAARAIGSVGVGKPEAAAVLRKVLGEKGEKTSICASAAAALGRFGLGEDVPRLVTALRDADPQVRIGAVEGLSAMGPSAAADAREGLLEQLSDEDSDVRLRVACSVWKVLREAAPIAPILSEAVEDNDPGLFEFVGEMGPDGEEVIRKISSHLPNMNVARIMIRIGAPAVPAVARRLSSENIRLRFQAARILGEIGPAARDALPALGKVAADLEEEEDLRDEARWAIGRIGR